VAGTQRTPDGRQIRLQSLNDPILPVAAIFGANASGKTNVIRGLALMRHLVVNSHFDLRPGAALPFEPFVLDEDGPNRPMRFEVDFVVDGVRHHYELSNGRESIEHEQLDSYPHNKRQMWFSRQRADFRFGPNLKGENRIIQALTRANSLFLSAAAQNNHPLLTPVYNWFLETLRVPVPHSRNHDRNTRIAEFCAETDQRERLMGLLRGADIGITGLQIAEEQISDDPKIAEAIVEFVKRISPSGLDMDASEVNLKMARATLLHRAKKTAVGIPLEDESDGTVAYLDILRHAIPVIKNGHVLCYDELDSSLHPLLCRRVVEMFQESASSAKPAQIIFNTHTPFLLSENILRRDQVWLCEKDGDGVSHMYPLTDFKPRKDENLQLGYLQGRYGGIPYLGSDMRVTQQEEQGDASPKIG